MFIDPKSKKLRHSFSSAMFREQLFSKKESQGRAFNFKSGAFMTNMPLLKEWEALALSRTIKIALLRSD